MLGQPLGQHLGIPIHLGQMVVKYQPLVMAIAMVISHDGNPARRRILRSLVPALWNRHLKPAAISKTSRDELTPARPLLIGALR